ncbi:MAG: hypothetical protein MK085_13280, partial [Phycisphaerales bacterium]|nr:hypothetical protein [Phycisphaerales bacterium]
MFIVKPLPTSLGLIIGFASLVALAWGAVAEPQAPSSARKSPAAEFHFTIQNKTGVPIPGRLTFTSPGEPGKAAFRLGSALPNHLALRKNVVATASGSGQIAVEPGRYLVTASRGPEWSIDQQHLTLRAGETLNYRATLHREIETEHWVGADLHLHTREFSGHSDASVEERLVTLRAEGVDLGVATDHDHA